MLASIATIASAHTKGGEQTKFSNFSYGVKTFLPKGHDPMPSPNMPLIEKQFKFIEKRMSVKKGGECLKR